MYVKNEILKNLISPMPNSYYFMALTSISQFIFHLLYVRVIPFDHRSDPLSFLERHPVLSITRSTR